MADLLNLVVGQWHDPKTLQRYNEYSANPLSTGYGKFCSAFDVLNPPHVRLILEMAFMARRK